MRKVYFFNFQMFMLLSIATTSMSANSFTNSTNDNTSLAVTNVSGSLGKTGTGGAICSSNPNINVTNPGSDNIYYDTDGDAFRDAFEPIVGSTPFFALTTPLPGTYILCASDNIATPDVCYGFTVVQAPDASLTQNSQALVCSDKEEYDLNGLFAPESTPGGSFVLLNQPSGSTGIITGSTLNVDLQGDYKIRYTVSLNGCTEIAESTMTYQYGPSAYLVDPIVDKTCTLSTTFNLNELFDGINTGGGTWTLTEQPGGGSVAGSTLTYGNDGIYTIKYEVTLNGCTESDQATIEYSHGVDAQFSIDNSGGCTDEAVVLHLFRGTSNSGSSTASWTILGGTFTEGTNMNSINPAILIPTPPGTGVLVEIEICLTESSAICDTELCKIISFYNDGQGCDPICNAFDYDVCTIITNPGIQVGCKFFTIEQLAIITIDMTGPNEISCADDGALIGADIKLFGISDSVGDQTIGDIIGNGLCNVLCFFDIIDDCDVTITQFIVDILAKLVGGDGAGTLLVADTDGDGYFDKILGDKDVLPQNYLNIYVPNNIEGPGKLTIRAIGSFPNSPSFACGKVQADVKILTLLGPVIGLIPVAGPIINAVLSLNGCDANVAISASADKEINVINDQPPFFANCATTPYMFSQDNACNVKANWSIPMAFDFCTNRVLRFQGVIDSNNDGFAEFDAATISLPGVWQTAGPIPGSYLNPGVYTVTYTARGCETTENCSFDVIITSGNPILECPNDFIVGTDVDECQTVVTGLTPVQGIGCNTIVNYAVDYPDVPGFVDFFTTNNIVGEHNDASGLTFPLGKTKITYMMQNDVNGDGDYNDTEIVNGIAYSETQMCMFFVTVEDRQRPDAYCIDIEVTLDEDGQVVVYAQNPNDGSTFIDGGSDDNCDEDPSILIAKPGKAFGPSVVFDCSELGTNFLTLEVSDDAGNVTTCIAQVTVKHFLSPYTLDLNLAEVCLGDHNLTQLDFSEYLSIRDEYGQVIDPDNLPADLRGKWSISDHYMFTNSFPGTIDPTTGQYTIGTGNGNVLVQYSLALALGHNPGDLTECAVTTQSIFQLYQPLVTGIPTCYCADDGVKSFRVVDLGLVEGGLPPYTIQFEGGGLDIDRDGVKDILFDLGEYTFDMLDNMPIFFEEDLGQLIVNEGETNWSVTVLDSRGCEIHRQGQCDPLFEAPQFIGANSPACFTDGVYSLSLDNSFDFDINYIDPNLLNGHIAIEKVIDGQLSNFLINNTATCNNHVAFNAAEVFNDVFIIDPANDRILVSPEALINRDYRYAGVYRITLSIPPSEETQCQYVDVVQEVTIYPSFDACFELPIELCGNSEPFQIDVDKYNPGYDNLANNLLCRDLDEMSVWELIAPNGTVAGTGTTSVLIQEGETTATGAFILEGLTDGDVIIDPKVLYAEYGPGNYTLNHEIGIDICKTSCTVDFVLLDFPRVEASTDKPVVCCLDNIHLRVDTIYGGTPGYKYEWTEALTGYSSGEINSDGTASELTFAVADLPGGCPDFDTNPLTAAKESVYEFIVLVTDTKGCQNLDTVYIAINPDPSQAPEVMNAIYCQTSKAEGKSPIKNNAFGTTTLRVKCGEKFDVLDFNGDGFIESGTCGGLSIVGDADGDGIPDVADADLNQPDADGDGVPDSADKDLLCIDADLDCIPDLADMDIKLVSMDTDCDGIPDAADTDADNDGVLDVMWDADQDGIEDGADVDADGDGLIDAGDADGDNIPDTCDALDNPLLNTITLVGPNCDGDAIPDECDVDDDNDGINDAADASDCGAFNNKQVVGCLVNYEGPLDLAFDADGDGIEDPADINSFPLGTPDDDGDGIANVADSDVDGDCICNTADVEFNFADTDGDGWPDNIDADVDNDGLLDNGGDHDNDGLANIADADHPSNAAEPDTDGDNIIDTFDVDDDNDGVLDTCDSDPLNNAVATILAACDCGDTDMDNVLDTYDIDDDNDGIFDEADASHPNNVSAPNADGDDIIDAFDIDTNGDQIADSEDVDSDGDGIIDSCDTDDDNDGILDIGDADAGGDGVVDFNKLDEDLDGLESSCDTDDDGDGIIDDCDADANGDNELDCLFPFTDADGNGIDDFGDADGDGIYNGTVVGKTTTCDIDSDNDGIVDYADSDINGDGIIDNGPDPDLDGVNDECDKDDDGDGIVDDCDADHPANIAAPDFDGDGQIDACDCDDDNDSVVDECDYLVAGMQVLDTDLDGLIDLIDADFVGPDTDGDGIADFADADVDGDGLPNCVDADTPGATDNDGDGINDAGDIDDDNDGICDALDADPLKAFGTCNEILPAADVKITGGVDANNNGVDDAVEAANCNDANCDGIDDDVFVCEDNNKDGIIDGIINPDDLDSDGVLNMCDIDDDNDGINNTCDADFAANAAEPDTDGDGIIDSCDELVYPTPSANWYDVATGGTPLFDKDADKDGINESDLDGDPSTFDPVKAGLVDPNIPGVYNFWVECVCIPDCQNCVSPRSLVTLTILDCQAEEDGCTYLLVLKDLGADGWDGASIDVSVAEGPATSYKVSTQDCDMTIIPITTSNGGFIDLTYWNGTKETEHAWCLFDASGNIAIDINGQAAEDGPCPAVDNPVRVKLDCPVICVDENDYEIAIKLGDSPQNQSWELRNANDDIIANALFDAYDGLEPGTIVTETLTLQNCDDYTLLLIDGSGTAWVSGSWQIIGTDPDRGLPIIDGMFEGKFEIAAGPISQVESEQVCKFTIPCKPLDCPTDLTLLTSSVTECLLQSFVHPTQPTPFVCYPNCDHADGGVNIMISYPDLGLLLVDVNTMVDLPAGENEVVYTLTYPDGQIVRCTSNVNVVTETNPTFTCNDHLIVGLGDAAFDGDGDCYVTISADHLLENTLPCQGQYEIVIFDTLGIRLSPTDVVGPEQVGMTLQYHVYQYGNTSSFCWGTITVEDKHSPVLECNDYNITCNHPGALDELFEHTDTTFAKGLPLSISGSLNSEVITELETACTPLGEQVKLVVLEIEHNHDRPEDLSIKIEAPNGIVLSTILPIDFEILDVFIGEDYQDLEGVWKFTFTDKDGRVIDDSRGRGSITEIRLSITAGFPKPIIVTDCSTVTLSMIQETFVDVDCVEGEWEGAKVERIWEAVDAFGNVSTCTQYIGLIAPAMSDIQFPKDVHLECGTVPSIPEEIIPEISGVFDFECFELNDSLNLLCDISISYEDTVIPSCALGFKILRNWSVINWCTNVTKNHLQTILVEDTEGPSIDINNIEVLTGSECGLSNVILNPGLTDNCSGIQSAIASYTVGGGLFDAQGSLNIVDVTNGAPLVDLPLGLTQIEILALDNCNNETLEVIDLYVSDGSNPVAICDDVLHISLDISGHATLTATDLDEGSNDNCGIQSLHIRRTTGCLADEAWSYSINFDCCDVDELVTVELRVTDVSGNTNICWGEILVEDPIAPFVNCQDDLTLNCDDPSIYDPFTEPDVFDACFSELVNTVDAGQLDNCKAGTITRTWTYTDGSSKSPDRSCTQRVTVEHVSDFTVQFPPDVTIDTCPNEIGDAGSPIILDDECELVAISHEDQQLSVAGDECYKILRTWTLINWCIYDDNQTPTDLGVPLPLPNTFRDDDGYFKYVQTIKVIDTNAPNIAFTAPDPCSYEDGCEGEITLTVESTDDCSEQEFHTFDWKIDIDTDGIYDLEGEGASTTLSLPYGNHTILWNVTDGCGNLSTESFPFSVEDCKNPTPVCLNGISIEVMNDGDGCVEVWASDLLEYAFDNCSSDEFVETSVLIRREGATSPPQSSVELCCDDVAAGIVTVEVWVQDEAGNSDYCLTYIIPQDNLGNCPTTGAGSLALIGGEIMTEFGETVQKVEVDISGGMSSNYSTSINGIYNFPNLPTGDSYVIKPTKDINVLNGVSTFDLVLISQHIIGITPLTSPYQLIAADINGNGTISTFDLVQLRQLILFIIDDLPSNTSWRFVDQSYTFPNPTNPWFEVFPESIAISSLNNSQTNKNFVAVKIGDVNGSANPNNLLDNGSRDSRTELILKSKDIILKKGQETELSIRANDFNSILGLQFTLEFDDEYLKFEKAQGESIAIVKNNVGTKLLSDSKLTFSFHQSKATSIEDGEELFTFKFLAMKDGILSELININSEYTPAEIYTEDGRTMNLGLEFNKEIQEASGQFKLLQNKPNPFRTSTLIGFELPESTTVTLKVIDVSGKIIKLLKADYFKGYNEIVLNKKELINNGVLIYQLETATHSAYKKMIIIE